MSSPAALQRNRLRSFGCLSVLFFLIAAYSVASAQTKSPSQHEDSLLFRDGEVLLSKGEREKALWRFKKLVDEYPNSPLLNEAKFRMGVCYTQLKRPKDAIRTFTELLSTFLAPPRMVQVFTFLGDNSLELKDSSSALQWYGKGLLVANQPKDQLKTKIKSVVDGLDTEEALSGVASLYRGAYAGGYAKLRLAQLAKARGDILLARKIFTELEREYPETDYASKAREVAGPGPALEKGKYTIGVILPLSGIHQVFGTRVLQAIQLALKEVNNHGRPQTFSLSVRDSKGNPREAEKAVEELVTKDQAIAIIGPLLSLNVDVAAKKAQQLKVPLLSLSQKEPGGKADFVFQNSLTPPAQVQALAAFAFKDLDLHTFGIFYPNSPYGQHYKTLFGQEVVRRGGRMLGSVAYHEEQTDFAEEIKAFFRVRTTQEYDSRKKKIEEFKPELKVDAIFVPDTYDRIGLILSQMAYFDVTEPIFLGTNAWNDQRLVSIAGAAAEGAVFTDSFFRKDPSPIAARFVEEFRKAYQRDPDSLEAMAYDSAKFLRDLLQQRQVSSPSELKQEISRFDKFQGVSGLKGFDEHGRGIRSLLLLKVKDGQIVSSSP